MSKAARGTKRLCLNPKCGGKFYDLNRSPIICPLCGTEFEITKAEEEEDRALALEQAAAEKAAADKAAAAEKAKVIDLPDDGVADDLEDELAELADEATDPVPGDDAGETFLETEDDDDGDVTEIIGAQIPTDEEES